jgi:hypothetical protein
MKFYMIQDKRTGLFYRGSSKVTWAEHGIAFTDYGYANTIASMFSNKLNRNYYPEGCLEILTFNGVLEK